MSGDPGRDRLLERLLAAGAGGVALLLLAVVVVPVVVIAALLGSAGSAAGCAPPAPGATPTATTGSPGSASPTPSAAPSGSGTPSPLPSGLNLTPDQVGIVNTTSAVAAGRGLSSSQPLTAIFAAGLVESGLVNLDHGDADSLGVWQERPSQGWGTPAQIMDVAYAAGKWFDKMLTVAVWSTLPPGELAADVENPAAPLRYKYALQVPEAAAIAAAVAGGEMPDCAPLPGGSTTDPGPGPQNCAATGILHCLRPRAVNLYEYVHSHWDCSVIGQPDCVQGYEGWRPTDPVPDHPDGRAVDFNIANPMGRNPAADQIAFGWTLAQFLQANAPGFAIDYIIWQGRIWSTARASEGWRDYCAGGSCGPYGPHPSITQLHMDHIHVSVKP